MRGISLGAGRPWEHPAPPAPLVSLSTQSPPSPVPLVDAGVGALPRHSALPSLASTPGPFRSGVEQTSSKFAAFREMK